MNRKMTAAAVVSLVIGALFGFVGSLHWSGSTQGALNEALDKSTRLEREAKSLRAENDRIAAQLKEEQTSAETIAGDLRREKEMNMRLQMLVSDGKK
jgi:hypothetical protein